MERGISGGAELPHARGGTNIGHLVEAAYGLRPGAFGPLEFAHLSISHRSEIPAGIPRNAQRSDSLDRNAFRNGDAQSSRSYRGYGLFGNLRNAISHSFRPLTIRFGLFDLFRSSAF